MTDDLKNEALEQLEFDIKFGFENEQELFESTRDMFYNEEDFDEDWLTQMISEKYNQHQKESLKWIRPTDFDKLARSFDQLIRCRIVCLHKAGYTKQDGENECIEAIETLNEAGIKSIGFCYYHSQDLARAVDKDIKSLYLAFDSTTRDDNEALQVANKVVSVLKENSFEINWSGTIDQKIEIKNINWQKVPDKEDWRLGRVLSILAKSPKNKKPFWKFW